TGIVYWKPTVMCGMVPPLPEPAADGFAEPASELEPDSTSARTTAPTARATSPASTGLTGKRCLIDFSSSSTSAGHRRYTRATLALTRTTAAVWPLHRRR